MANDLRLNRRRLLASVAAGAGTLLLGGCDEISDQPWVQALLAHDEKVTMPVQRTVVTPTALAREYTEADLSPAFKANGSTDVDDPTYQAHVAAKFADWKLPVGGLVERPGEYSLADLRALPSRTQITRHDCVEGWSCIGKWKGTPLGPILDKAGLKPEARYILFTCADDLDGSDDGSGKYYETIDLQDAHHPQTILAYDMNDAPLTVPHGAPLRVRVERQLGYKMAKYVMRIDAIDSFASIHGGKGGYWEDRGYEWYGGI